jgi:hypothetical protein
MDAQALTQAVLMLLTPYVVTAAEKYASKAGEAAWQLTGKLFSEVKAKFNDDDERQLLNDYTNSPQSEESREAFQQRLLQKIQSDDEFSNELATLFKQLSAITGEQSAKSGEVNFTTVANRIDKQFNIDKVEGSIHFHDDND